MLIPSGVRSRAGRFAAAALVGATSMLGGAVAPGPVRASGWSAVAVAAAADADAAPPAPLLQPSPLILEPSPPPVAAPPAPSSTPGPTVPGAPGSDTPLPPAPGAPEGSETAATASIEGSGEAPGRVAAPVASRPRFTMSAAVGISVDHHGISDGRSVLVPSFAVQGGVGDGLFGFGMRLFASEAAGRYSSPNPAGGNTAGGTPSVADLGADRQAVDLLLVVHPAAPALRHAGDDWVARFVRALAVEVGVAGERVSIGTRSILREGAVVGAHLDLPLLRSGDGSELRATAVVRRMLAASQSVDIGGIPQKTGDSKVELFAGLTVAF